MKTLQEINAWEETIGQVMNCDALELMKRLPDKSVDLVLTDPPYGVNYEYKSYVDMEDNLISLLNRTMPEILRVGKRVILTCGHTNMWKYPKPKWVMAWVNSAGANMNSWGFTCWQPILCYGKDAYLQNRLGARQDIIVHSETSEKFEHSCPKPITFWKKLLLRGSVKETDIILDPFMGSFTTAIAAESLGRRWIGCDLEKRYCQVGEERLKLLRSQPKLL